MKSFTQNYHFILQEKVQWGDMDAFGHVNNTVYFRYFERVRFAMFEEYGLLEEVNTTGIGPVLASTQCRFKMPLEYPDTIYLGTSISGLEHDRFLMHYGIFSEQLNTVAALGEGFIIYYNYQQKIKSWMPDKHYQKLVSLSEQKGG
ncbi:MAG: acyl-CoA thioesterase [Gammaproteobacteria bacterium]|nr:acyl-CoA thioesterase [Gammaproteobacteria bacterium]